MNRDTVRLLIEGVQHEAVDLEEAQRQCSSDGTEWSFVSDIWRTETPVVEPGAQRRTKIPWPQHTATPDLDCGAMCIPTKAAEDLDEVLFISMSPLHLELIIHTTLPAFIVVILVDVDIDLSNGPCILGH